MLLEQFLVTRVDTEVVIEDYGEEHPAHPTASRAEDTNGDLPKKRRADAPVSRVSPGLLESLAMFHRRRRGHLGRRWPADDGGRHGESRSKWPHLPTTLKIKLTQNAMTTLFYISKIISSFIIFAKMVTPMVPNT